MCVARICLHVLTATDNAMHAHMRVCPVLKWLGCAGHHIGRRGVYGLRPW